MRDLLVIKEKLKKFVGKNEVFILPVLKFLMVFIAMTKINSSLGFMSKLSNGGITLIVALAGSFLPLNLTLVILALIITAHMYKLSMECAILVLALFVIMFLLLWTKVIKLSHVENVADFFLQIMPFFFVAPTVGLMTSFDAIKGNVLWLVLMCFVSTVVTIAVTGAVAQLIIRMRKKGGKKDV